MDRFVVISGCSGGGKSTLLNELARRGHAVVEEPGRRVVVDQRAAHGTALPWTDMEAFARRALEMALADHAARLDAIGWVFFDRGIIDAASALAQARCETLTANQFSPRPYNKTVFMTPPWPEIYQTDSERRHDFAAAVTEYQRLCHVYPQLGYDIRILPKASVSDRADFVIEALKRSGPAPVRG
ncbi:AAA family ATPase [Hoeflea sp. G2-23]|uniref:AAA family ATPase n=1 Tax=Hoeflea algicola TaxID=2983763 RepID=A0ABT3Z4W1_9HYPH|nr:AAA family ATPase [Hoeflea algicola]MCY0146797.1 AAA family ATPase [Hoeflea algicola]